MSEPRDDLIDTLSVEQLLQLHLKSELPCLWTIRDSHIHGRGLFATRDIEQGEVIFRDEALVIGPRSGTSSDPVCVGCLSNSSPLSPCSKNCALPVCSSQCENSVQHSWECSFLRDHCTVENTKDGVSLDLVRTVTPIRCLQMSRLKRTIVRALETREFPICEVDVLKRYLHKKLPAEDDKFLRLCCGTLDTNAYAGTGHGKGLIFRGLYALSAMMNHSCTPNTTYWFDEANRMVVKAARTIGKEEEILSTYTSLLWGTATRRSFLSNTKEFLCRCARCKDPTEFDTNLSAIYCKTKPCGGILLPGNPLDIKSDWLCSSKIKEHKMGAQKAFQLLNIWSKVAQMLTENEDLQQIQMFLKGIPENSQSGIQIRKYFVLQSKGQITDMTNEMLLFKEQSCYKLLDLIKRLKLGRNYLKGLILRELFHLLQEKSKRSQVQVDQDQVDSIKTEFEKILKFDVTPQESG
ncbi:hypothetical protein M8J76_009749 [Diaphorina citri]|nr:hypothetical protein M8J76_009749 [Diaphorina citri]KAI5742659.1 hypothetical protein M8J77_009855 [Diaphorina citri]